MMLRLAMLAALLAHAGALPKPATRADFDAFVSYFAAESATWQQDNEDAAEGEPVHWVRRHSNANAGDTSKVEVAAVYADGRCEPVTTIHYRWSRDDESITTETTTTSGITFRGSVEPLGGARYRTIVHGTLPDGTDLRLRDTSDLSVPDSSPTTAERWSAERWEPLDAVTWRRVAASAWCMASDE